MSVICNLINSNVFNLSALCIHVSPECREVLEQLGGYILEERGFVEMKVGNLSNFAFLSDNLLFFRLIAYQFYCKLTINEAVYLTSRARGVS